MLDPNYKEMQRVRAKKEVEKNQPYIEVGSNKVKRIIERVVKEEASIATCLVEVNKEVEELVDIFLQKLSLN